MKERPILFSAPMVRALLAGTKTQTRRAIRDQSIGERFSHITDAGLAHLEWLGTPCCGSGVWDVPEHSAQVASPYGQPGDRLWVRETHAPQADCWGAWERWLRGDGGPAPVIHYAADFKPFQDGQGLTIHKPFIEKWRPSIHMPRWASRITLEVTEVRVERLQDISIEDAKAEGAWPDVSVVADCEAYFGIDTLAVNPYRAFQMLWERINGPESWAANPWVWAITFKRVSQ